PREDVSIERLPRALRSLTMQPCTIFDHDAGTLAPQRASAITSALTTSPGCTASAVRTTRSRRPRCSPPSTVSGPRTAIPTSRPSTSETHPSSKFTPRPILRRYLAKLDSYRQVAERKYHRAATSETGSGHPAERRPGRVGDVHPGETHDS